MNEGSLDIFFWGFDLKSLDSLILKRYTERLKHHFRHFQPCVVNLYEICLFFELSFFDSKFFIVAFNRFCHEFKNLLSVPKNFCLFLLFEHCFDCSFPLLLPFFLLEFSSQHFDNVGVLFFLSFCLFFIKLLL